MNLRSLLGLPRYRKENRQTPFSLAARPAGYCRHAGYSPSFTWEIALSRIWDALKQAEKQRSREGAGRPVLERPRGRASDDSDRRERLRHSHSVPLLVYGSDADKQPFHEEAETHDAHEDGCSLTIESVVARGQRLFLTNTRNQAEQECRVVHVGRRIRGKTRIGVAFIAPAPNFWRPA